MIGNLRDSIAERNVRMIFNSANFILCVCVCIYIVIVLNIRKYVLDYFLIVKGREQSRWQIKYTRNYITSETAFSYLLVIESITNDQFAVSNIDMCKINDTSRYWIKR